MKPRFLSESFLSVQRKKRFGTTNAKLAKGGCSGKNLPGDHGEEPEGGQGEKEAANTFKGKKAMDL